MAAGFYDDTIQKLVKRYFKYFKFEKYIKVSNFHVNIMVLKILSLYFYFILNVTLRIPIYNRAGI